MAEYNLVYKFKAPEGYYGCRCRIISHGAHERVLLEFDDGRKLMRSKFSVTSVAKFNQAKEVKKPNRIKCQHCNGKGWVPEPQGSLLETDAVREEAW